MLISVTKDCKFIISQNKRNKVNPNKKKGKIIKIREDP